MFTMFEIEMKSGINSNNKMYEKYRVQRGETIVKPNNNPKPKLCPVCGHDRSFSGHKQGIRPSCPFFGSTFGNRNRRIQFLDSEVGKEYRDRTGRTALDPKELKETKYMSQRSGDKPKEWLKRNEETPSKRSDSRDRGDRRGRSRD